MKLTSLELLLVQIYKTNRNKEKYKELYKVLLNPTLWTEMPAQELFKPASWWGDGPSTSVFLHPLPWHPTFSPMETRYWIIGSFGCSAGVFKCPIDISSFTLLSLYLVAEHLRVTVIEQGQEFRNETLKSATQLFDLLKY